MGEKKDFDELLEAASQQIDSKIEEVLAEGHDPDLQNDLDSMKIWAPWTDEVVSQLNLFQERGNFHPFTCPNEHETKMKLVAICDGWVCPVNDCDYRQDWAWQAMADPRNILTLSTMPVPVNGSVFEHSNPREQGCTCVLTDGPNGWAIKMWNSSCKLHTQLEGSNLDPDTQGRHRDISKEELDAAAFPARNDAAGQAKLKAMAQSAGNVVGVVPGVRQLSPADLGIEVPAEEFQEVEVVLTVAGIQQLDTEDLFNIFTDDRLRELFPNFSAQQQLEIQEFWKFEQASPGLADDNITVEEYDKLLAEGTPVEVQVDLDREDK